MRFFWILFIPIIQSILCPQKEWQNQLILATKNCEYVSVNCSKNLSGKAKLECKCNGEWSNEADESECGTAIIADLGNLAATQEAEPLDLMKQFRENIRLLVSRGKIRAADILNFVNAAELLLAKVDSKLRISVESKQWRSNYSGEFCQSIGESGDDLLDERAEGAWMSLKEEERIDRASRLMTLLQNMLVVLGSSLSGKTNASIRLENFEGRVRTQPSTLMPNRDSPTHITAHFIQPETPKEENISFSFSQMELPNVEILGSLLPKISLHPNHLVSLKMDSDSFVNPPMENTKIGYFMYSTLGKLMSNQSGNRRVNSQIIGAFVGDPVVSVNLRDQNANFTFRHLVTNGVSNPSCVFWDLIEKKWSSDGCFLVETTNEYTRCSCEHLTSFSILMDFTDSLEMIGGRKGKPLTLVGHFLDIMTVVGCLLSALCLSFCVLIFSFVRSLHNIRTTIHRNLCICLLAGQLLFVFGINRTENREFCGSIAVGLHFFFVCSFMWMLLEGYQLYLMLIKGNRIRTIYYYGFGYGIPALIVLISVLFEPLNYGTEDYCWINVRSPTIWAFLGPISAIIAFNSAVLFVALRTVLSVQNRDRSLAIKVFGWLKGSAMLLCLLGVTWAFGFLTAIHILQPLFAIIFTLLNSLQGVFIFVLHILFNDKARQAIRRYIRKYICCSSTLTESSNDPQSSSVSQRRFFALHKDRLLQWWLLKSHSNTSNSSQKSHKSSNGNVPHLASAERDEISSQTNSKIEMQMKGLLNSPNGDPNITVERF